jgi:hypothetical protein
MVTNVSFELPGSLKNGLAVSSELRDVDNSPSEILTLSEAGFSGIMKLEVAGASETFHAGVRQLDLRFSPRWL